MNELVCGFVCMRRKLMKYMATKLCMHVHDLHGCMAGRTTLLHSGPQGSSMLDKDLLNWD